MNKLFLWPRGHGKNSMFSCPIIPRFCWICGRKFWGDKIYVAIVENEGPRFVHKSCGEQEGYEVKRIR